MASANEKTPATPSADIISGSWGVRPGELGELWVYDADGEYVCSVGVEDQPAEAVGSRARLIRAAPELLTAADLALGALHGIEWDYETPQHRAYLALVDAIGKVHRRST